MRWLVLAIVLGSTSLASADVVFPPPTRCPPGALPRTSHGGPHCTATECTSDAECAVMQPSFVGTCAPAGLCVRVQTLFAGRGRYGTVSIALGSCRSDADCSEGIACVRVDRCIAEGSIEGPVDPRHVPRVRGSVVSGCGAMGMVALLALAGAASIFAARRASRASRIEAIRERIATHRVVRRASLDASDAEIAHALAPIASRVRVEVEDDEVVYSIDEEPVAREDEL